MENRSVVERDGRGVFLCPEAVDTLETGVICCLLDEELTFLWGNSSFFRSIHCTRGDFVSRYPSLREFYAGCPKDFMLIG